MGHSVEGIILTLIVMMVGVFIAIVFSGRIRTIVEPIILFGSFELLTLIAIYLIDPQDIAQFFLIGMFASTTIVIIGLRLKSLIKDPYDSITQINSNILTHDLTPIDDTIAEVFTGTMGTLYDLNRKVIGTYGELLSALSQQQQNLSNDGNWINENAGTIHDTFIQTTDNVDKILQSVVVLSELIDNVRINLRDFANAITDKFQDISQVLNSTDRLTDQTNLIAVNAAIEAAHSGKEGENFGIVADSIQNLSQRSRASTDRLTQVTHQVNNIINEQIDKITNELTKVDEMIYEIGELSNDSSTVHHQHQNIISELIKLATKIRENADSSARIMERFTF